MLHLAENAWPWNVKHLLTVVVSECIVTFTPLQCKGEVEGCNLVSQASEVKVDPHVCCLNLVLATVDCLCTS